MPSLPVMTQSAHGEEAGHGRGTPDAPSAASFYPKITSMFTFGVSTYKADPSSRSMIEGQTLTPGGAVTVSKTSLSLLGDGATVVIGSNTQFLFATANTLRPVLLYHSASYTTNAASGFSINGQTLSYGKAITVDGTRLSVDAQGFNLVL